MLHHETPRERFAWSAHGSPMLSWLPTLLGVGLAGVGFAWVGPIALLFLLLSLASVVIAATRSTIGRKVDRLAHAHEATDAEAAESKIVCGTIEAPGLALLTDSWLTLIPIVGEPVRVALDDIEAVEEVSWFNGTKLWWKRGFLLQVPGHRRLAFAVAESTGARWASKLQRRRALVAV